MENKSYRDLSGVIGIFKISPDRLRQAAKLVIPFKGYLGISWDNLPRSRIFRGGCKKLLRFPDKGCI